MRKNKIYLNYVLALLIFFYRPYTSMLLLLKKYYFHASVRLVCHVQRFFPKIKLVKTSLRTQLKQTNLENWLHIWTESPKDGLNDTVFQNFVDGLKHCKRDMWTGVQVVPVFLCLYSVYLVVMLPQWSFFTMCFPSFFFLVNV